MTGSPAAPTDGRPSGRRSDGLDLFKAMLVVGMVAIHVFQLLGRSLPVWVNPLSDAINLITFSGFLLALGIGVGLSRDRPRGRAERLVPALLLLGACWLSSFAFALLVDRARLTPDLVVDVLSLRRLFGWSEFLASFFMLYLLLALGRGWIVRMATDNLCFALSLALSFLSTWVRVDGHIPLAATLVGTADFASFPILPYLPWFLLGIRIGRDGGQISPILWAVGFGCTGLFLLVLHQTGRLPDRFPPSALWVAGPALVLFLYWGLASRLTIPRVILGPGRHVLSFLLLSNLIIFAARNLVGRPVTSIVLWLAWSLAILVTVGVLRSLLKLWPAIRNRREVPAISGA